MALCIVRTGFRWQHWNIGDKVELFGEELESLLASGDVDLDLSESNLRYQKQIESVQSNQGNSCDVCFFNAKSPFGLMAHVRAAHKAVENYGK